MNKKGLFILLGIIGLSLMLMVLPFVSACGGPAPTTTPPPKTTPPPTTSTPPTTTTPPTTSPPPTSVKPIVLRMAMQNPPAAANSQAVARWVDSVNKQSGGRLQIQVFYGESLAKASEVYRATQTGVADIGYTTIGNDARITPLSNVTRIPFLGMPAPEKSGAIFMALYNKFPEIQREWAGMKPLVVNGLPGDQFHFTKKDVRSPSDIKGLKIIARGEWPEVVKSFGAVPVDLMVGDWFTGLERGLVEGQVIHFLASDTFGVIPLYKYNLIIGDGASQTSEIYLINQNSWNGLPADLQKLLTDSGPSLADDVLKTNDKLFKVAEQKAKDLKEGFYYATPDEIKVWMNAGKARITSWLAENTANGLPAQAVLDEAQKLIAAAK